MKIGDTRKVFLGQYEVADAVVVDIDDDKVYLEVPATRIVMGLKTDLGDLDDTPPEVDRDVTLLPPPGGETSDAIDEARAALLAEGVELDEDDDYTPPPADGSVSLKEMRLDDDV